MSRSSSEERALSRNNSGKGVAATGVNIVVFLLSLILSLALAETLLRSIYQQKTFYVCHPDLYYFHRPDFSGLGLAGEPVYINGRGFRDHEYDYQKDASTIRILGLGDSMTFGQDVGVEDTFLKVLKK